MTAYCHSRQEPVHRVDKKISLSTQDSHKLQADATIFSVGVIKNDLRGQDRMLIISYTSGNASAAVSLVKEIMGRTLFGGAVPPLSMRCDSGLYLWTAPDPAIRKRCSAQTA